MGVAFLTDMNIFCNVHKSDIMSFGFAAKNVLWTS